MEPVGFVTCMDVIVGTHPIPQNGYTPHQKTGSWDSAAWNEWIPSMITDEKTRLAYDPGLNTRVPRFTP